MWSGQGSRVDSPAESVSRAGWPTLRFAGACAVEGRQCPGSTAFTLQRKSETDWLFQCFQDALVFAGRELELQFRMSRPLTDFMATLHKNGVEEKRLSKFVSHAVTDDDIVTFVISFPEEGQYGLDIYTRELASVGVHHHSEANGEKHLLTHCCKYLINSSKRN